MVWIKLTSWTDLQAVVPARASISSRTQYACAVLLIVSSIALVAYQVIKIDDVAGGLLYYVAQSFLLAGSIFGLDQYIRIINKMRNEK